MLAAGVAGWIAPPPPPIQVNLLLAGVAVLGAPHGVFDLPLLWRASRGRPVVLAGMTGLYLALGGLMLAGWALAPLATLVVFLILAALHFGMEHKPDAATGPLDRIVHPAARGLSVIVPLVFLHPAYMAPWVSALADRPAVETQTVLAAAAPFTIGLWAVLLGVSTARRRQAAEPSAALELLALSSLFVLAPPLLAFAVYFTTVHAVGHVLDVGGTREVGGARSTGPRRHAWRWLAAWLAPAALVCTFGVWTIARLGGLEVAALQSLRILAALAAPHLLLGPWLERRAGATLAFPPFSPPLPSTR